MLGASLLKMQSGKESELTKFDDQISEMCFSLSLAPSSVISWSKGANFAGEIARKHTSVSLFFSFFFPLRKSALFFDRFFEGK